MGERVTAKNRVGDGHSICRPFKQCCRLHALREPKGHMQSFETLTLTLPRAARRVRATQAEWLRPTTQAAAPRLAHTPPLPLLRCSSRLGLLLILKVPPEASLLTATDEES